MRRIFALALGGVLASLLLVGCQPAEEKPGKTEFVLFDLSASTANREVRARYLKDFERILEKVGPGDKLVVDRITDNPLAQSTFPVNESFRSMNSWTENPLVYKRETGGQREKISATVKGMLSTSGKRYQKTSILDALQLAQRVFSTYANDRQVLILFSDMVEESTYYDFTQQSLRPGRVQEIIAAEKKAGRLPDLAGVDVYIVGALAGYYSRQMDQAKVRDVQEFWLEYFRACGADLPLEHYGSALLEPPE